MRRVRGRHYRTHNGRIITLPCFLVTYRLLTDTRHEINHLSVTLIREGSSSVQSRQMDGTVKIRRRRKARTSAGIAIRRQPIRRDAYERVAAAAIDGMAQDAR